MQAKIRSHGGLLSIAAVLLLATIAPRAGAHDPGLSFVDVRFGHDSLFAEVVVATKDLSALVGFDDDGDDRMTNAELGRARTELNRLAANSLELSIGDELLGTPSVGLSVEDAGAELVMRLEYPSTGGVAGVTRQSIRIRSTLVWRMAHGHRQMVRLLDERGRVLGIGLLHRGDDSLSQVVDSIR